MINLWNNKIALPLILTLSVAMVGCPGTMPAQQASFTKGSGSSLGTLSVGNESFDIQTDSSGNVSRVVSSLGGSFELDEDGNFSKITTADGSTLDFTSNADGSFSVVLMDSQLGTIQFEIPADALQNAKGSDDRAQEANISCDDISLLCETARFIIEFFLTDIVDEIVATAVAQTGIPDFLIRPIVQGKIDGYVDLIKDFCDGWDMILANEGCPL